MFQNYLIGLKLAKVIVLKIMMNAAKNEQTFSGYLPLPLLYMQFHQE
jgi:hypothetical protein